MTSKFAPANLSRVGKTLQTRNPQNPNAAYACINRGDAVCPNEIERQSICIDGDIGEILSELQKD